jgi:hypothetical protein
MMRHPSPNRPVHPVARRGALLLLVLSMLSLFLMLGTLMIVMATRARTTSRAFAGAVAGPGLKSAQTSELLEEALLVLIRGTQQPASGGADEPPGPNLESLLADRYGTARLTGELRSIAASSQGLVRATVSILNGPDPRELVGRVLTIQPPPSDPAPVSSFRIHRVGATAGTSITLELANLRTVGIRPLPTISTPLPNPPEHRVFINGRDFEAEPWDAFDDANTFLTSRLPGQPVRAAFQTAAGQPLEVDNDGDGSADGVWLENILPRMADGSRLRVSYLVHDLGGQWNVNAHGSIIDPLGDGIASSGPAAVDGSQVLPPETWRRLLRGLARSSPLTPPAPPTHRPPPVIMSPNPSARLPTDGIEGRFGSGPQDTYGLRLDFDGPRLASRRTPLNGPGNLFTCGELEWVLRQFDSDTTTLPPRLAALLGGDAEAARLLITTDSWDYCGIVGDAANRVLRDGDPATLPWDARAGVRFNLDRPLPLSEPRELAARVNNSRTPENELLIKDFFTVITAAGVPATARTAQWVANVIDFLDRDTVPDKFTPPGGLPEVTGVEPSSLPESLKEELGPWDQGFCESAAVLLAVPPQSQTDLEERWEQIEALPEQATIDLRKDLESLAVKHPKILDVVTVASPFRSTVFAEIAGGQIFSRWREPGRINVNTCDDRVWQGLSGGNGVNPFGPSGGPPGTARSTTDGLLRVAFRGAPARDFSVIQPNRVLANRFANSATTRSDVFAVWVTLEVTSPSADFDADRVTHSRLFAIIDRSIPVGYELGMNLNARDTIRVLRRLE